MKEEICNMKKKSLNTYIDKQNRKGCQVEKRPWILPLFPFSWELPEMGNGKVGYPQFFK
jgi:hypothetical protein